jgi:molybdopterin synthase catalytic subunit
MKMSYLTSGPVSSGAVATLLEKISGMTGSGGHSLFLGQVRADEKEGKRVSAIEYSAYEAMVESEADKIRKTVLEKYHDVNSVDIIHSVGTVRAGEISLVVLVSAGHRKEAMEACSLTVELIKKNLPVWKKEIYEDDSYTWK